MIYQTTYQDQDIVKRIEGSVGSSYSLVQRLHWKGIGSERIRILRLSPGLQKVLNGPIESGNIEIRPKGVLVHFKMFNETFAWTAPFNSIRFFKNGDQYTIYSNENYIKFESAFSKRSELDTFINKALRAYKKYQSTLPTD